MYDKLVDCPIDSNYRSILDMAFMIRHVTFYFSTKYIVHRAAWHNIINDLMVTNRLTGDKSIDLYVRLADYSVNTYEGVFQELGLTDLAFDVCATRATEKVFDSIDRGALWRHIYFDIKFCCGLPPWHEVLGSVAFPSGPSLHDRLNWGFK